MKNWVDLLFDAYVVALNYLAGEFGITYTAINIIIFVIVWPFVFLLLFRKVYSQRKIIKYLLEKLNQ